MLLNRSCGVGPAKGAGCSIIGVSIIGVTGPSKSRRASGALTIGLIDGLLELAFEHRVRDQQPYDSAIFVALSIFDKRFCRTDRLAVVLGGSLKARSSNLRQFHQSVSSRVDSSW